MTELWLNYTDEKGEKKRLPVEQEKFAVGRHSENDLSIANSAISRQHIKIERFADIFVISDVGSSLGTTLNGEELTEPAALKKGDRLKLGESFEIEIELVSDSDNSGASADSTAGAAGSGGEENKNAANTAPAATAAQPPVAGSSIPTSFYYIAPILGLVALLSLGGILLAISSGKKKEVAQNNDFVYTNDRRNSPETTPGEEINTAQSSPLPEQTNENFPVNMTETPIPSTPAETNSQPNPEISGELGKVEVHSISFLRRIAQSQQGAFLTGRQQEVVQVKINQFKGAAALADNLKSAKKNASQIQSLASSKNLKPQFLTTAALARLGNNRGDVLQAAQSIAEVLDELSRNIGDERADDALLVIAGYEQGAAGDTLGMRNMLQNLVNEFPGSSRQIRSIWFLKEKGKLTDAQFESAVRFLAIGTITQNPKDFGVNAEAVIF